jgi:signal transduction histidine kinase
MNASATQPERGAKEKLASLGRLRFRVPREAHVWIILAIMTCGTLLYYADSIPWIDTVESTLRLDFTRRSIHRILSILPVAYAAAVFGLQGGLLASLVIGAALLPRVFLVSSEPHDALVEVIAFVFIGAIVSWLIDVQLKEKARHGQTIASLEQTQEELQSHIELGRRTAEQLRFYVSQVLRAQEAERLRIARELHDDTAQALTGLSRRLDMLVDTLASSGDQVPHEISERLEELRDQSDTILEGVRRFSRDLRPPVLDDLGLLPALKWLVTGLEEEHGIAADVRVVGEQRRLPTETELAVFRIAQEALNNVWKHSGASAVELSLDFRGDALTLAVADNGKGFDVPRSVSDLAANGKLGVIGMEERVRILGGTLSVRSELGAGTCVVVTVPA